MSDEHGSGSFRVRWNEAKAFARGSVNPLIIRAFANRAYDWRNSLVITGFPRSGTTWLAELVACLPHTAVMFEPLSLEHVPSARAAGFDRDNFRLPGERWPTGEAFLRSVLSGRVLNRWTTSGIPLARTWSVQRWIVKFVRANQMLVWLTQTFDLQWPVFIVRHPCAVYASWVQRGWPLPPRLHDNPRFVEVYPEFAPLLRRLATPEEYFAARWCQAHYHTLNSPRPWPFQLVLYEQLRADPAPVLRKMMDRWRLPVTDDMLHAIEVPSGKASSTFSATPGARAAGWVTRLDPGVVKRILGVVEAFGLDFYDGGGRPDPTHPLLRGR